ncbi:MAG: glycosyltransferase family 4 protein, partial [Verrucomicrobiota bacterium]
AGGGTRIKILEAFQFGRPVVSTAVGAEGLEVENEVHLLVADDGESFVQACLKLVEDPSMKLHRFLTRNAAKFVRKEHPQGLIDRRMMGLLNELSKG